jgi:hypothetical protein
MLGMGPILWHAAHKRAHAGFHALAAVRGEPIKWRPPVPRKWATIRQPAALLYYKALDRINLGFRPW